MILPAWIADAKAQVAADTGRRSRFLWLSGPLSPADVEAAADAAGLIPGGYILLQDFEGGGDEAAWADWLQAPTRNVRRYSASDAATLRRFHADREFVRVVVGPYGSGKSTAHVNEIIRLACQQTPDPNRQRKTRWAVVRNSFPQLTSTTIKTWQEWVPHSVCPITYGSPITGRMRQRLNDGTEVDMEVFFIALNLPKDVDKLLSLELTGAWVNEAREIDRAIIDAITGRVGRYPAKISGASIAWSGLIADTNPPDELHFLYKLAEETPPETLPGWRFYRQPPAVLETNGQYRINPYCENLSHQPIGADYWLRMIPGKTREWIKVYLQGEYGTIAEGKPIYESHWSDSTHVRPCTLLRGVELVAGWDFGLTPAFVLGQVTPSGRLEILDEIVGDNIGVEAFVTDFVLPLLARKYAGYAVVHVGDPAGAQRAQTDERTVFDAMRRLGIPVRPAPTQDPTARWEAVRWFLGTMVEGKPRFALDPACKVLRKGFGGGYCFRRIQTAGTERYAEAAEKNIFSHCFTGDTPVSTPRGLVAIRDLRVGDWVETPVGKRRVTATMSRIAYEDLLELKFSNGAVLTCTRDHPFAIDGKRVRADELQYNTLVSQSNKGLPWLVRAFTGFKNSTALFFTGSPQVITKPIIDYSRRLSICTAPFGSITTDPFQAATKSTTRTTTKPTTRSKILRYARLQTIAAFTQRLTFHPVATKPNSTWPKFETALPNGIVLPKDGHGIKNTENHLGKCAKPKPEHVTTAANPTRSNEERQKNRLADFVRVIASATRARQAGWTTWIERALSATRFLESIGTQNKKPVRLIAARNHPVGPDGRRVYDLTVDDAHVFFANGILVFNCHDALQYACAHLRQPYLKPRDDRAKPLPQQRPADRYAGY